MLLRYEVWLHLCDRGELNLEQLEQRVNRLRQPYEPDGERQINRETLYTYASGCFACAMLEKKGAQYPYGEHFRELLDNARQALLRMETIDKDRAVRSSEDVAEHVEVFAFRGLVDLELFRVKVADGIYEEAFAFLADSMFHTVESIRDSERSEGSERWDLAPQEAIRCFERLKANPTQVRDWAKVKATCDVIHLWWVECGLDYDEEVEVEEVEDNPLRGRWTAGEYWAHAMALAESRLSPDQLRSLKEAEDKEHAERHLCLFFGDRWDALPQLAKDALIQAETMWWSRSRSSKSSVVDNLWKAAVEVIKENLWGPFVGYVRSQPVKELPTVKVLDIDAQPGWEPGLNNFIQLMWRHPRFGDFLRSMNVSPEQTRFLTDLETQKQLKRLNELRKRSVHPSKGTTIEHHEVSGAYRTFLGIGCEGVLPRLARLKR